MEFDLNINIYRSVNININLIMYKIQINISMVSSIGIPPLNFSQVTNTCPKEKNILFFLSFNCQYLLFLQRIPHHLINKTDINSPSESTL